MIRRVYPALDALMPGDFYAAYQLGDDEFVSTVPRGWRTIRHDLGALGGYESTSILSAAKYHPDDADRVDVASLRRVDPTDPRRQYHVHLFDEGSSTSTSIYSHLEYRPDLRPVGDESIDDAIARLREHYSPSWGTEWGDGVSYVQGAHCDATDRLVRMVE